MNENPSLFGNAQLQIESKPSRRYGNRHHLTRRESRSKQNANGQTLPKSEDWPRCFPLVSAL